MGLSHARNHGPLFAEITPAGAGNSRRCTAPVTAVADVPAQQIEPRASAASWAADTVRPAVPVPGDSTTTDVVSPPEHPVARQRCGSKLTTVKYMPAVRSAGIDSVALSTQVDGKVGSVQSYSRALPGEIVQCGQSDRSKWTWVYPLDPVPASAQVPDGVRAGRAGPGLCVEVAESAGAGGALLPGHPTSEALDLLGELDNVDNYRRLHVVAVRARDVSTVASTASSEPLSWNTGQLEVGQGFSRVPSGRALHDMSARAEVAVSTMATSCQ